MNSNSFKLVRKSITEIAHRPWYLLLGLLCGIALLLFQVWLSNVQLLQYIFGTPAFGVWQKFELIILGISMLRTNFTWLGQVLVLVTTFLSSMNFLLLVYYFQKNGSFFRQSGVGILGLLLGVSGLGCSVCGSVILTIFIGITLTTTVLGLLPFGGFEISLLGLVILLGNLWYIGIKLQKIQICEAR